MIDSKGVIHTERKDLNKWKSSFAIKTRKRTISDALDNADVFLGLSAKGILNKKLIIKMTKNPIIVACTNPDQEITPEKV